jgi:hypothetical protein
MIKKAISYKYDKNHIYNIKMRYEFDIDKNNKPRSCYIYFNTWEEFLLYYKNIDENKRHFYEMFNNRIKFFLDIDCKENYNDKEWNILVNTIKNSLINFLNNMTSISNINVIRCESKYIKDEPKRSCHLIVEDFSFETKYCKELYKIFIKTVDEKLRIYIDDQVYGENRCLRIIGSSKIGSRRVKYDFDNLCEISFKHFVSNIDNTTYIETCKYYKTLDIVDNVIQKGIKKLYSNYDVSCKNYLEVIKIVHNSFGESVPFFKIRSIKNNIIICDLVKPYYCKCCNRTHELENPFIIIKGTVIHFYCRRNNISTKIIVNK